MSEAIPQSEASRLAKFMGLRNWSKMDDVRLVEKVAKGLPIATVAAVVHGLDPKGSLFTVYDFIPKPTYYRLKKGKKPLTKDQSEMVFALSKVLSETNRQFHGDEKSVFLFLSRSHPLLAGRSPVDVARESTAGADLVLKLLAQAEAGVAV